MYMAFIKTGLPNGGRTTHYKIKYDDSLSPADGVTRANGLLAKCEQDFSLMQQWFGGIDLKFAYPIPVHIANASGGAGWSNPPGAAFVFGAPSPTITLNPGSGMAVDFLRYLLVSEVTEMFMTTQDKGWAESTTFFSGGDEGSKGEGLSRFLGVQFQLANGLGGVPPSNFGITSLWLNSPLRQDFVDVNPDDTNPDAVTGCTTLFLYYLSSQLGFGIKSIVAAGASSLAVVHKNLTGSADGWTHFHDLVNSHYPPGPTYNPPSDNIFPVSDLSMLFPPNQVTCGYSEPAQIFIDHPAKAEVHIALTSDDPAVVTVPPSVTVPAGSTSASIKVAAPPRPIPFPPKFVNVHANYAGKTLTMSVEVVPPAIASITLSPATVVSGTSSIGTVSLSIGTVSLNRPSLLGPVVVDLICGAPGFATVPAQMTIPQNQISAQFTITIPDILIPFVPAHAVIFATYSGSSSSATLTVNPKVIAGILDSLTLFPSTVTGGNSSTGMVTLVAAVSTPTRVGLAAQEIGPGPGGGGGSFVAEVPSEITIGPGQTSGVFDIRTNQVFSPMRTAIIVAAAVVVKYAGLKVTS
jgi:hypothetical protein